MKCMIIYPTTVGEHHVQQFDEGPTFPMIADAFGYLWSKFGKVGLAMRPDPLGIPFEKDGVVVAYVVFTKDGN